MLKTYIKVLNTIFTFLGSIVFIVLISVTFLQVILRYIFSFSLPWSEEFLRFIFAWMILFGFLSGTQIQVSLLRDKLLKSVRWIFAEFCYLIILSCLFILLWGAINFFQITRNDYYAAFDVSISWFYFPLIISSILEIIRVIFAMITTGNSRKTGEL